MIVWSGLIANGLLFTGAWWFAEAAFRQVRILDRLLAAAVLGMTWCLLGLEVLGTAGLLEIGQLAVWMGLLFAIGLATRWRRPGPSAATRPSTAESDAEPWRWESLLALALVLWVTVKMGMQSLLLPVKVVSDGPIYHLYFAVRWWKAGRLFLVAVPFGENAATYFPANGDAWFTWLMVAWGGDRLARIGQAPFLLLAAVAVFRIAQTLGARRNSALLATCWFVTSTPFLIFSFEANVDTIFVASYLSAVYFFLLDFRQPEGAAALILGALAAGLALGTKPVGVVFIPPLLVFVLGVRIVQSRSIKQTLAALLRIVLCVATACGYWFGRNLLLTANPLYPLHVELFGRTILPGWYGREAMRYSIYYLPMADWRALLDILLAMADPRLALLWIAALAGAWAIGSKNPRENDRWTWTLSALALLNIALYWVCIPYRTQQRFTIQALGLAAVPLARLLDCWRGLRLAAAALLMLHVLTPQGWPVASKEAEIPWDFSRHIPNAVSAPLPLISAIKLAFGPGSDQPSAVGVVLLLGMGCCAGVAVWAGSRLNAARHGRVNNLAMIALGSLGLLGLGTLYTGALGLDARNLFFPPFRDFYSGWLDLEGRSGPSGARLAYAGTNIPYYLFGTGLRNEVRYVNIDGHPDWLMHDYHRAARQQNEPTWPTSRPGWDRAHPDFPEWLANLRAARIQLLVVTRADPGEGPQNVADAEHFPIERIWADAHPEIFEPLYGVDQKDPFFRIYRVRGSS